MTTEVTVNTNSPEPTSSAPTTVDSREPRRFGVLAVLIPWILVAMLLATTVVVGLQWRDLRSQESARAEAATTAIEVVRLLTEWDASDGLDDTRADLKALAAGEFATQIDELFGSEAAQALEDAKVSSSGEIGDVFVQSIEGDTAEVFAVVTQTKTTEALPTPEAVVQRAAITLEHQDGKWVAVKVELTSDDILTSQQ